MNSLNNTATVINESVRAGHARARKGQDYLVIKISQARTNLSRDSLRLSRSW